jgi:hypothetical protein
MKLTLTNFNNNIRKIMNIIDIIGPVIISVFIILTFPITKYKWIYFKYILTLDF